MVHPKSLRVQRLALAMTFLPFVVAIGVLFFVARGKYMPISDHALTEMQIKDIGHHPVLVGLFSRNDWSHPGPMLFYALAPFYWITGGSSLGMWLGALAINGACIAGIAFIARRRGGTMLMVWALLASALLMRTLSADVIRDPWNNFVVVFPFALLIFLVWAMTCGERWALLVGAIVASFLTQTHVGFVVLAAPLFGFGALWLIVATIRSQDKSAQRRLLRTGLWTIGVVAVLWLPVAIDALTNSPSNLTRIMRYFQTADQGIHTFAQGFRVMSGQFTAVPEWLTSHRMPNIYTSESSFLYDSPAPIYLLLVVLAGVALWRIRNGDGLRLYATFAAVFALGVIAIDRTIGLVLDYRLRWTWVVGMVGGLIVVWAALLLLRRWQPKQTGRIGTGVALVGILLCSVANCVSAAQAGVPQEADVNALAALLPNVLGDLENNPDSKHGQIVIDDTKYEQALWYARSMTLQLEKRGYDARMPPPRGLPLGKHREADGGPVAARYLVLSDRSIEPSDHDPTLHQIAKWSTVSEERENEYNQQADALDQDYATGKKSPVEFVGAGREIDPGQLDPAIAWAVAVYRVDPGSPAAN